MKVQEIRKIFHDIKTNQQVISMSIECLEDIITDEEGKKILAMLDNNYTELSQLLVTAHQGLKTLSEEVNNQ
ncbi:MAG: hypothetical protein CME62_05580 [Halobacteriovoraceae bacterium]|nr:hypothetical protein [Halobacteriovoraceae bacterium]|tara:strand:- start:173 stop:388 length:216 start_codon:yes stop_codon:yes gene_type:complete